VQPIARKDITCQSFHLTNFTEIDYIPHHANDKTHEMNIFMMEKALSQE